ncbi:MAG TPA: hypothetical protein VK821_10785 [Dehalococcoidia bacterium]|nr:hypothetical protein [Dehalococcoidia bacterium]
MVRLQEPMASSRRIATPPVAVNAGEVVASKYRVPDGGFEVIMLEFLLKGLELILVRT